MNKTVRFILISIFISVSLLAQTTTKTTTPASSTNNNTTNNKPASTTNNNATNNKPAATNNSSQLYLFAQTMPSFPGGEAKLREYIIKNFNYPDYERTHGISGTSNVSFVVEKDGSLTDIKVVKGVPKGSGCDAEGIRLVKQMPKWKPGIQGGKVVRVQMSLPIIFTIQKPAATPAAKPKPAPAAKPKSNANTK